MKGNRKMNKFGDFPFLVGVTSNRHAVKLENSTEAVADFICTKGVDGDLCILTLDGDKVLDTFGIYINKDEYKTPGISCFSPKAALAAAPTPADERFLGNFSRTARKPTISARTS